MVVSIEVPRWPFPRPPRALFYGYVVCLFHDSLPDLLGVGCTRIGASPAVTSIGPLISFCSASVALAAPVVHSYCSLAILPDLCMPADVLPRELHPFVLINSRELSFRS